MLNGHGVYVMDDMKQDQKENVYNGNMISVNNNKDVNIDINVLTRAKKKEQEVQEPSIEEESDDDESDLEDIIDNKASRERANIIDKLHKVLGHPSDIVLGKMLDNGNINGCMLTSKDVRRARMLIGPCKGCLMGKMTNKSMKLNVRSTRNRIAELIHADIMEFADVQYLITVDDKTGYVISVMLSNKRSDTIADALQKVVNVYRNLNHGRDFVIEIKSDSENCFIGTENIITYREAKIKFTTVGPDTHEKVAERTIRTIKDKVRSIIYSLAVKLPIKFYGYVVEWIVQCINLVPNNKTNEYTPHELVIGKKLDYNKDFKLSFGDVAYFKVPYAYTNSVQSRAEIGMVVGRVMNSPGIYKVYLFERKTVVRRYYYRNLELNKEQLREYLTLEDDSDDSDEESDKKEDLLLEGDGNLNGDINNLSVKQAINKYGLIAEKAIYEEFKQIIDKSVFSPEKPNNIAKDSKLYGSLMFLKMKRDESIKARFCVNPKKKFDLDKKSFDYLLKTFKEIENYAPTINLQTFVTLLGVGSYKRMKYRMSKDVKGAFLNAFMVDKKTYLVIEKDIADILSNIFQNIKSINKMMEV
eukprot:CAMPEP_0196761266 /NCGR_PEP_ID=MMETSP1095-20130614/425_1 /TAXON_ID=96789 ORGANISM="Chromulina nebulosa, Strain UTEXLB2642" /NCGR_SAMPLE_ID=MMETSP1095 /ASSEMBLY_ACC=CAM_ASM_000446 /LENGTH=584 /DNA_ID=CAMNT_0042110543 /DNA_START=1803 /DNA_END=3558 /DNA_ORIENTATION=-